MLRLFIALPLPLEVETYLGRVISDLEPEGASVKWVQAKNIHLTVKFLGDTEESLVPQIRRAIEDTASRFQSFDSRIDSLGAFPNLRKPRVIWAGSATPADTAAEIAETVDSGVQKLGFERETRRFKPHLTLGRVRQGRSVGRLTEVVERYQMTPIDFRLDELVLFKSTLTPQGAIYDRLVECRLGEERFGG